MTQAKKDAAGAQASSRTAAKSMATVQTEVEAEAGPAVPQGDALPEGEAPAVGGGGGESVPTDARERFRQALEAKNARPGDHPGSQSAPGAHLKGSNSKRKREFRRKSG